jgi:DNA-directed RNA polymerase alpha subunit
MDRNPHWEYRGLGKRPKAASSAPSVAQDAMTSIEVLDLSVRAYNCLRRGDVYTVEQLARLSDEELLDIWALGKNTLDEIKQKLAAYLESHPQLQMRLAAEEPSEKARPDRVVEEQGPGIEVLGLSVRAHNSLFRAGIESVGQLATLSDEEILAIHNLGKKSVSEIREKLDTYLLLHPEVRIQPPAADQPVTQRTAPGLRVRKRITSAVCGIIGQS